MLLNMIADIGRRFVEKNEDRIIEAMCKVNEGGNIDDIDTIVDDFYGLIKAVHGKKKPIEVKLDPNYSCKATVDGELYEFDFLIRHNDMKNTERKMEIDVLFTEEIPIEEVERRLIKKINEKW